MDLSNCFQPSYRVSRERLLERAHALAPRLGVTVDSRAIAQRGPDGETLALDFTIFGARRPTEALVLSSGTHGVEGFLGSAVQHYVLDAILPRLRLAGDTAVILQHANNPYGFAWRRRVNEANVDFNRNFRDRFDPGQCSPDYEQLFEALNPADLDASNEARRWRDIGNYIGQHGERRFQQTVAEGQYKYPQGIQFGGREQAAGTRHLLALVREHLAGARRLVWLDFHTGLGASGACELVTGAMPDSPSCAAARAVWGDEVKSAAGGESISTPLNGLLDRGVEAALPPGCGFAFAFPEYGTHPFERVFRAMRADNWLHAHGDPASPQAAAIKQEMMECFRPDSREWERTVLAHAAGLVSRGLAALPGARLVG